MPKCQCGNAFTQVVESGVGHDDERLRGLLSKGRIFAFLDEARECDSLAFTDRRGCLCAARRYWLMELAVLQLLVLLAAAQVLRAKENCSSLLAALIPVRTLSQSRT